LVISNYELYLTVRNSLKRGVSFPVAVKDEEEKKEKEGALLTDFLQILYTHLTWRLQQRYYKHGLSYRMRTMGWKFNFFLFVSA
jgi:hypothetical protein